MKALFLDIDGVLQPVGRQERFEHRDEIPAICTQLNQRKHTDFDYEMYIHDSYSNACDIGAVYFDWDEPSMERLRRILDRHPEITAFVALDDRNLEKGLDGHFVYTRNRISEEDTQRSIEILNREDGPFPLDDSLHTPELQAWREMYVE